MTPLDANNSELRIYVRRAGLLKRFGHDLELCAHALRGELDFDTKSAWLEVDAAAIRVVSAVERRERRPGLSPADREQIDKSVAHDVLAAGRHPRIEFRSSAVETLGDGYRVRGTLELHGCKREVTFATRRQGERLVGELTLQQPEFGIEPFRALGGALKLEPTVEIVFSLPGIRST